MPGVRLSDLTWSKAEAALHPDAVCVLPLGASSKEHGHHLRLDNDLVLADYWAGRVLEAFDVVVLPTLGWHFYPAFVEYPGSVSLRLETARDLVVDIVRSIARHGPRRFYVLNTGVSTVRALAPAGEVLASEGVTFAYTDVVATLRPIVAEVGEQEGGTHADEIETSMMLVIAPDRVDMSKAARDFHGQGPGPLSRTPGGPGVYSPTGAWGDPTLASRAKGERVVQAYWRALSADLTAFCAGGR